MKNVHILNLKIYIYSLWHPDFPEGPISFPWAAAISNKSVVTAQTLQYWHGCLPAERQSPLPD